MTLEVALVNEIEKETKGWPESHGLHTKLGLEHFHSNLDFILCTSSAFPSML